MSFYPEPRPVPASLRTDEFVLLPLAVEHTALDHAALMDDPATLRLWSGTSWPDDDFTLAQNESDLAEHFQEFEARVAFAYTVLDPDQTRCLGCVYINPLARRVADNPDILADTADDTMSGAAVVGFWVRASCLADGLEARLLAALRDWLAHAWAFSSVAFVAREADERQIALLTDAGLDRRHAVTVGRRQGLFALFYEPPADRAD